ncbi:MAG: hypothetical protein BJ554DRAFT_5076 [Olpidium bornovanus]|uniref:Cation efflux protein transmembrane domain-containing protein n=1 Tax=Olpidium bornovanus TaxID=278681 RepID=A0A8H7ZM19_9FUNG|nr:MAG: hypothetical protein BJ554DRAFT_5076 [Olpidium bornovanus]
MSWPNCEEPEEGCDALLVGPSAVSEATGVARRTSPRVTFTDADDAAEAGGSLDGAGVAGASLRDSAHVIPSYGNYGRNTPSILNLNCRKDSSGVSRKPTERDPLLLESWKKTDDELQALKKSRQGRKVAVSTRAQSLFLPAACLRQTTRDSEGGDVDSWRAGEMRSPLPQRFYEHQNEQIDNLLAHVDEHDDTGDTRVKFALRASVAVNVLLFGLQAYAASTSGSLSLFATMADAFMDLLSSLVLLVAERISGKGNRDKYPTGATRMETAGIIVFSCLMSTVSIQLLIESVKKLIAGNEGDAVDVGVVGASCLAFALFSKLCLYMLCARRANESHTCRTLAQDHRNDLLVNGFGLAASLLGTNLVWWVDPAGAIIIALIILKSWTSTAYAYRWQVGTASLPFEDYLPSGDAPPADSTG